MDKAFPAVSLWPIGLSAPPGPGALTLSLGLSFHLKGQSGSPAFSVLPPGPHSGASVEECHSPPQTRR